MKNIKLYLVGVGIVCFSLLQAQIEVKSVGDNKYGKWGERWYTNADGRKGDQVDVRHIIVKFKKGNTIKGFNFSKFGLKHLKIVRGPYAGGFYELLVPENQNAFDNGKRLYNTKAFEYVFMNTYSRLSTHETPNDDYYSQELHWNLERIKMPETWDITTGSNNVTVAVVDVGVEYSHPDLVNNIGPGGKCFTMGCEDEAPETGYYHGTAVAGIIAAGLNNGIGVSGMAGGWGTSGVKIMALRVGPDPFTTGGGISNSAAAEAIEWAAVEKNVKIINGSFNSKTIHADLGASIDIAVAAGALVVFSSGNANYSTNVQFPANKPNVIAVGATTKLDIRKKDGDGADPNYLPGDWESCYGNELDVVAPGVSIPTTDLVGIDGKSSDNYYPYFNGTSAAAPHVAALAALLLSVDPTLTNTELGNIIRNTADKVPAMNGSNYTQEYGYGRINAYSALLSITQTAPSAPTNLIITNPTHYGNHPDLQWWASSGATSYNVYRQESYAPPWDLIGSTTSTTYTDDEVFILNQYYWNSDEYIYQVKAVNNVGESSPSNTASVWGESYYKQRDEFANKINPIPEAYALDANYPNPFNPITTIKYELPEASSVTLVIYDLRGNEVTRWTNGNESAGYKRKTWNATDKNGNKVPAGIYLFKLTAKSKESGQIFTETLKMVLLK
ncbi:MAG: S8 family serine peptidase [Candidatus Marinimicrobia bacterium]|jgi:subtilisin family serine protease|nr:S8 family serine peptidase [Candidatus Neomarinimicrobiota bacterium]MBT4069417.1 S8 family serine peptidase [Candidatus Neomarinimicrobiota bacterium]MBT4271469.1 S8 family serine peptidase [Candidatus Neomarinimicrobiota bacterium]MBT6129644.1 S8 family serine peptidase [Candidatus Neomarinimicrobiota bacterium]MBT6842139.1 S8 family serine peptidase [Candidatus Neomarinimicrobiota bacterium]